jgi:hypothetical protein
LLTAVLAAPAAAEEPILGRPGTFSCAVEGGLTFPQSAFRNPTGAERGRDEPARLLRRALREFDGTDPRAPKLPAHGWRELVRTAEQVEFHNDRPEGIFTNGWSVTVEFRDGRWQGGIVGQCAARRVVPGHEVPEVTLPVGRPRRSARALTVLVTTGGCGGEPPEDRLERIEVLETRHTVTVLALLRPEPPPPPGTPCPAVGHVLRESVDLARPLGGRAVRDASRFPPAVLGRAR